MIRHERFVGHIGTSCKILEIGALHRPTLRKPLYDISFADFADTDTLRALYAQYPNYNINDIVDVDYVIKDGNYKSTFAGAKFNLVLGSHVGEHMPDFVGWLHEIYDILEPGGILSLILPDKRFTFDLIREDTSASEWLANHHLKPDRPTSSQIHGHIQEHVRLDGLDLWNVTETKKISRTHNELEAWAITKQAYQNNSYYDTHCSILTPRQFLFNLARMEEVDLMPFELDAIFDTAPHEIDFQIRLRRPLAQKERMIKDCEFAFNEATPYHLTLGEAEVIISPLDAA